MAYGDMARRAAYQKVLFEKTFNIAKNPKYEEYQPGLASIVYRCFDKKCSDGAIKPNLFRTSLLWTSLQDN